jgi:hypothetical protein
VDLVSPDPVILLVHDGELADVCALLGRLGAAVEERRGPPTREDAEGAPALVVATPKRMLEFPACDAARAPTRIAILDNDSRTLRAMLRRAGIDLVVRRPFHPAVLRLLVLHSLYRGPEKRRASRVGVGTAVRFRSGLRRHTALLADLSLSGCRLITDRPPKLGRRIAVRLPADLGGGRPLALRAMVARIGRTDTGGPHHVALAVTFEEVSESASERLRAAVLAHAAGPAVLRTRTGVEDPQRAPDPEPAQELPSPAAAEPDQPRDDELPSGASAPITDATAPAEAPAAGDEEVADSAPDRRTAPRRAISRHVIALDVNATRVLMGRDISAGGMRVDPNPALSLGDEMQIAIHVRAREEPLVLTARVARDDGERGLVLQFCDLTDIERRYLDQMIGWLPILAMREDREEDLGVIVSEILEPQAS